MANPTLVYGASSFELPYPHKVDITVTLPFDTQETGDDSIKIYDWGTQYDKRVSICSFFLTTTEQENLDIFLYTTARGQEVTLNPGGENFHPFGPDKGDDGPFTVTAIYNETPVILLSPFRRFVCSLLITNTGSYPAYSLPSEIDDGLFDFASVINLRYPQRGFNPSQDYNISINHSESSTPYFVDKADNEIRATSKYVQQCNESKAAALLYYLTNTMRSSGVVITDNTYYYIFGSKYGDGTTHTVNLYGNTIKVSQKQYDNWEIDMSIKKS